MLGIWPTAIPSVHSPRSWIVVASHHISMVVTLSSTPQTVNSWHQTACVWIHQRKVGNWVLQKCWLTTSSSTFCALGVVLQSDMLMTSQANPTIGRCFWQLRLVNSCVKSLTFQAVRTVVNSYVTSRIDYCNSLQAGIPKCLLDRLKLVLAASAKLFCGCQKFDNVSSVTDYTGCLSCDRALSVAGPRAWNKLPVSRHTILRLYRFIQMKTWATVILYCLWLQLTYNSS